MHRHGTPLALALLLSLLAACGVEASSDGGAAPAPPSSTTTASTSTTTEPDDPDPDGTTTTTEGGDTEDPDAPLDRDEYVEAATEAFRDADDLGADPGCYAEAWVDTLGPTPFADADVSPEDLAGSLFPGTLLGLDEQEVAQIEPDLTLALAACPLDLRDLFEQSLDFSASQESIDCVDGQASQPLAKSIVVSSFDPSIDTYARGMGSIFQALGRCPGTLTELTVEALAAEGTTVSPAGEACLQREFTARGESFVGLGGDDAAFQARLQEAVMPCASVLMGGS